jgi:hypothetical protein
MELSIIFLAALLSPSKRITKMSSPAVFSNPSCIEIRRGSSISPAPMREISNAIFESLNV